MPLVLGLGRLLGLGLKLLGFNWIFIAFSTGLVMNTGSLHVIVVGTNTVGTNTNLLLGLSLSI